MYALGRIQSSPGAACPLGYINYALQTPASYGILES